MMTCFGSHLFAIGENNHQAQPLSLQKEKVSNSALKKWQESPEGKKYLTWKGSPAGKKVQASYEKIKPYIKRYANMEAVVTSVTFRRENTSNSSPKWLIVSINGEKYMMQFSMKGFEQLKSLSVNDKIIVRSRNAYISHNHPYLIISGDYISYNNKVLFKRDIDNKKRC